MSLEPYRVLIVDDDEFVRINLVAFFEDEGIDALTADSGEAGLERIKNDPVDVAVVDMRLPGMDGNAFIIEAAKIRPRTRFVIHTGSIDYSLPEEIKALGLKPEDVFLKPVTEMNILLEAVNRLAGEARQMP